MDLEKTISQRIRMLVALEIAAEIEKALGDFYDRIEVPHLGLFNHDIVTQALAEEMGLTTL